MVAAECRLSLMITKKYNIVNNAIGWAVFVIALATYWLTLEPTASYWDCGEFIIQADKLEIGHPPGNPIFMLTARFFSTFATDAAHVSLMVNAMSGLLSALTILLLFWTITHLVRRLVVKNDHKEELSLSKYLAIMGSGVVGALAYAWSDTFWFSAVEGEVYAFSSFCTALVFWLILKWENRADLPHSDRYLILIAYVIGLSIAVHLLNLLCIPAIVLVFVFRKYRNMSLLQTLGALLVSFVIIALVLYGMVPGFIKMAQRFELLFVNGIGLGFNSGAMCYVVLTCLLFFWALYELRRQKSPMLIKVSFFLAVLISGMLFIGSGWWLGWILMAALAAWLWIPYFRPLSVRVLNVIMWSITVIFIGYSSYALILIRSTADTPMNQNSPDNVFDLAAYLSREQYGENPLLYGETFNSTTAREVRGSRIDTIQYTQEGVPLVMTDYDFGQRVNKGKAMYAKGVKGAVAESENGFLSNSELSANMKLAERGGDYYVLRDYKPEYVLNPELNMVLPRIYSRAHRQYYGNWVNLDTTAANMKEIYAIDAETGEKIAEPDYQAQPYVNPANGMVVYPARMAYRPTYGQNLEYFFNYQLNHMYWRYFLWNFAGRQNDVLNQNGEYDAGNWITGIPFLDNSRLGDQSELPDDLGKENKGHNVYYMLPLLLGLLGLLWQALFAGRRGIEQFWVVFFLFFMTGIAIVIYLNQPPMQPRERDYAFAGSFYAFAIWIGMGVSALWKILGKILAGKKDSGVYAAAAACVLGLAVPLQMVSQTWDDHDRSGRYAARDFAINYLESLEPDAIVFCNGDNDTFPLWYAQEVEGVRPDVKIINLSYLASDWYANQMRQQSYTAAPVHFTATPADIAYGRMDITIPGRETAPADLLESLKLLYKNAEPDSLYNYPMLKSSVLTIPVDKQAVIARGLVAAKDSARIVDDIVIDLSEAPAVAGKGYLSLGELLMLDIIATNAAEGWPRPIYWCSTVGTEYHLGLSDYLASTGMTHQLLPTIQPGLPARTDKAYGVVSKYRWGGLDTPGKAPYYDETARRMLITTRTSMMDVAAELISEGDRLKADGDAKGADDKYRKALKVVNLIDTKLPEKASPYTLTVALTVPEIYGTLGERLNDPKLKTKAVQMLQRQMKRMSKYLSYDMMLNTRFTNPSTTPETRLMKYQFYKFIELYKRFGGDGKWVTALLKPTGYSEDTLRQYYNQAYGGDMDSEGSADVGALVRELSDVAAIVNQLAGMSAADYAAQSEDNRILDSIFYGAVQQYIEYGVPRELVEADPEIKKVDMNRSKRLHDAYQQHHVQGNASARTEAAGSQGAEMPAMGTQTNPFM